MSFKGPVFCLLLILVTFNPLSAQLTPDPEVFYLKTDKPLFLKAQTATPVYGSRSLQPLVKTFNQDDELQLLAYHPQALFVRNTRTGYEGWVEKSYVTEIDPKWIEQQKAEAEEAKAFAAAIKNEEVLPGMTFDHVQSALGKPTNKTFRTDEKGRLDIWAYVDFERQTEYRQSIDPLTRKVINVPYVVKIPVGSLNVEFKNGRVTAIERTRNASAKGKDKYR
jgi:hypothetical protein